MNNKIKEIERNLSNSIKKYLNYIDLSKDELLKESLKLGMDKKNPTILDMHKFIFNKLFISK